MHDHLVVILRGRNEADINEISLYLNAHEDETMAAENTEAKMMQVVENDTTHQGFGVYRGPVGTRAPSDWIIKPVPLTWVMILLHRDSPKILVPSHYTKDDTAPHRIRGALLFQCYFPVNRREIAACPTGCTGSCDSAARSRGRETRGHEPRAHLAPGHLTCLHSG